MYTCQPLNPKSWRNELLKAMMLWDHVNCHYRCSLCAMATGSLLLVSHTAMGYLPLVTLCSFSRVHFACYTCFYAFAMQLWPLLASTHDSPLWYFYVYLHAWWRSLLLLPCLSCASCYRCYFAHILLSCLCYVMWIIHAHYLHPWHACRDPF